MEGKERAKVLEKIKKLLRLAKSSNEHEAALAAAHAQRLLAEHSLREEDLTDQDIPKAAGVAHSAVVKKAPNWVFLLSSSVAGAFDCAYAHSANGYMLFIGVDPDHEIASFTFGYLYRTINRLAAHFMSLSRQRRLTLKGQRKARVSYCTGAASVIAAQLRLQKEQTPITCKALVPVKSALIEEKCAAYGVHSTKRDEENISERAYWQGRVDGAKVDHGRRAMPKKKKKPLRIGHRG